MSVYRLERLGRMLTHQWCRGRWMWKISPLFHTYVHGMFRISKFLSSFPKNTLTRSSGLLVRSLASFHAQVSVGVNYLQLPSLTCLASFFWCLQQNTITPPKEILYRNKPGEWLPHPDLFGRLRSVVITIWLHFPLSNGISDPRKMSLHICSSSAG